MTWMLNPVLQVTLHHVCPLNRKICLRNAKKLELKTIGKAPIKLHHLKKKPLNQAKSTMHESHSFEITINARVVHFENLLTKFLPHFVLFCLCVIFVSYFFL